MAHPTPKLPRRMYLLVGAMFLPAALACYLGVVLATGQEALIIGVEKEKASATLAAQARQIGQHFVDEETRAMDVLAASGEFPASSDFQAHPIAGAYFILDPDGETVFPRPAFLDGVDPAACDFNLALPLHDAAIESAQRYESTVKDYGAAAERYKQIMDVPYPVEVRAVIAYRAAQCEARISASDEESVLSLYRKASDLAAEVEPGPPVSYLRACAALESARFLSSRGNASAAARECLALYNLMFVERSVRLPAPTAEYIEVELGGVMRTAADSASADEYDAARSTRKKIDDLAAAAEKIKGPIRSAAAAATDSPSQQRAGLISNFTTRVAGEPLLIAMRRNADGTVIGFRANIKNAAAFEDLRDFSLRDAKGAVLASSGGTDEWASAPMDEFIPGWRLSLSKPAALEAEVSRQRLLTAALTAACVLVAALCGAMIIRMARMQARFDRAKADFLSSISHELCTPVAAMRAVAETLESGAVTDPGKKQKYLRMLEVQTTRLSRLIDSLLEFSAGRKTAAEYHIVPGDLGRDLGQAVESFKQRYEDEVEVSLTTPPAAVTAEYDGEALRTAIGNVLDNAYKYSTPPRVVSVSLAVQGGHAKISVSDNGIGVPAEDDEKIFDRFYRGSDPRVRAVAGSGIGLSLVREIVRAHGGDVTLQGNEQGGSTFTIRLPLSQKEK